MNRSEGMTIAIALFALVLPQYMLRRTASRPFSISAILFTLTDFYCFFLEQTIKESQLKQLLSHNPEEHMKAYRILESLQDHDMTLAICDSLLSQNLHVGQTLFILQFMLTNLSSLLSPVRTERLLCTKMGAKALLCLPVSARPNYEHLVSRPPLLLEQLLMNMKVEWAAKVFQRIQVRKDYLQISSPRAPLIGFSKVT